MAAKSNLTNMVLVLGATCLFCSAILGGAYALTKEPIEAAAAEKTNRAIAQVLPAFETAGERQFVEALGKDFPYYEAKNGEALAGYAIESTVVGFGGNLTLMVGITPDRVVYNTSVLAHSETPGLGAKCTSDAKFVSQWQGFDPSVKKLIVKKDGGDVDAITASTITSRAYAQAVENALVAFDMLQAPDATSGATKPVEEGGQSNE
jgi:electron transport complex protein RnfG